MTLDQWFLEHENMTYKEFIELYNDGRELVCDLSFFPIPKELKELLPKHINLLEEFLEKIGILEEFIEEFKARSRSGLSVESYMNEYEKFPGAIMSAFTWPCRIGTPWSQIDSEWRKYVYERVR